MAYYTYKAVRDVIPQEFKDKWMEENGKDEEDMHDCEAYDWDFWIMTADYIKHLKAQQ